MENLFEETKQHYLFDEEGYFVGDSLTQEENSTEVRPPQPCWKPQWNGEEWIETATDEEINPPVAPAPPTDAERIEALEHAVLELMLNV